jgi:hypothetical protein
MKPWKSPTAAGISTNGLPIFYLTYYESVYFANSYSHDYNEFPRFFMSVSHSAFHKRDLCPREYTAKAYAVLQSSLIAKANDLGGSWTPESVGKVLWIISILSANGVDINSSASGSSKSKDDEKDGKGDEEVDDRVNKEESSIPKKRLRKA